MGSGDSDESELSAPPPAADTLETLLAGAVGAPASYPLLAPATVIADRYEIERLLGSGGMGAVYLARDRVLDRLVALKLHRTPSTSTRLRSEAIAMAKLAHPNVITVFEVGEVERRPFVAMEYVAGFTLREWLAERTHTTQEILDAVLAAGEGLAVAHDTGLVHRDVKPENILIGTDGRVRIGDFGLAQLAARAVDPGRVPIGGDTATGTVVGTPAYMAPEQLDGGELDARTDQFGFCVVVWEALAGERPFTGSDTVELRKAIGRGVPRAPRGRVSARLRRVLMRGLAVDPAARWPSMRALLAALRSAQRRPRVIAAVAAVVLATTGLAAWALWPTHDEVAACDAAISALDRVLPDEVTVDINTKVGASGAVRAAERAATIRSAIGDQRTQARRVTQAACRAHARRQWSAELAIASQECLAFHARTVRELLLSTPPEPGSITDLVQVATHLPEVESCGDARMLAGWRSLAEPAHPLGAVIAARARLETAMIQLEIGRLASAKATLQAIEKEPVARARTVRGRVELLRALVKVAESSYTAGEKLLADAYFAARADDDAELALRVVAELMRTTGNLRRDRESSERWIRNGLADAARERLRYPRRAAIVYLAAASVASLAGDSELALARATESERVLADHDDQLHRSAVAAMRTRTLADLGRWDEALAASDQLLGLLRSSVGDHHPAVADALGDRATLLLDANHPERALAAITEAKAIIDGEGQATSPTLAAIEITLGATLIHFNDPTAKTYLEHARANLVAAFGEDHPDVALVDTNLALLYLDAGDIPRALAALRHAVAVQERVLGGQHVELAATIYNLAVAERQAGELAAALASARRAAVIYELRQPGSVRHIFALGHIAMIANLAQRPADALTAAEQALALPPDAGELTGHAWAKLEGARALISLRRDTARARTWLDQARIAYDAATLPDRVTEVDALRAQLR